MKCRPGGVCPRRAVGREPGSFDRLEGEFIRPGLHKPEFPVSVLGHIGGKERKIGFGVLPVPTILHVPVA